ncbi:hypothetical protein [Sulfurospirillum arcachonense]|uniref:hypothetical protein n=1 Tax=Sulfurospirillum arcachonense TaxID=57666 RepID=UPI0004691860|nr:hypothetical protein [Sulfurospirillum arcachonense]
MQMDVLSNNEFLDNYILNKELCELVGISSNAYRFWKNVKAVKYDGCRAVFLDKRTILEKYKDIVLTCKDLTGFVQSQAFCKYTGIAPSHLIEKNNSVIYKKLEIIDLYGIKLVNLKKFYDDLNLDYKYNIYVEKCKYFGPSPFEKKIKLSSEMCLGYY